PYTTLFRSVKAEKIEEVAHKFIEEYGNIDLMHSLKNVGRVVESYIAPVDLHFGEVSVPKGSWMMGVRVTDDETWDLVKKGRLTGFSIMGMRTPAVKELGDNPTAEKVDRKSTRLNSSHVKISYAV